MTSHHLSNVANCPGCDHERAVVVDAPVVIEHGYECECEPCGEDYRQGRTAASVNGSVYALKFAMVAIVVIVAVALLTGCGDPCAHKQGCVKSHEETRYRDGKCLRSHKEQQYHNGLVWHILKPHWRWEMKADDHLTEVCDERERVPYQETVCDKTGDILDADGKPVPEDYEGCEGKRARAIRGDGK